MYRPELKSVYTRGMKRYLAENPDYQYWDSDDNAAYVAHASVNPEQDGKVAITWEELERLGTTEL